MTIVALPTRQELLGDAGYRLGCPFNSLSFCWKN
jgi:hypothetical protein